jgi:hypothetical protein
VKNEIPIGRKISSIAKLPSKIKEIFNNMKFAYLK